MLADEFPEIGVRSPSTNGGTAVSIHVHVDDADAVVAAAAAAGGTVELAPRDFLYGERRASGATRSAIAG
jgi:uncharacterized glyoxalase superfamily protein PhnB